MTTRLLRTRAFAASAAVFTFAALTPRLAPAQQVPAPAAATGRIVGRIIDAESGAGLSDAGVQVVGTTLGTMSGVDGRFALARIPAGTVTIQVRRIGYAPKTVTGLMLSASGTLEQDVTLSAASVQLTTQVVTASAERGTVNEALDRQRTATGIVSSVTSEQIAKSPDGDAAAAVQRVSGVTVQEGRFVVVRGLGERYTTATLNGARLPSPEPERKTVPLDLFPSALLQAVTTSKTFTPDQSGDFSGAEVDIRTREFPARGLLSFSSSIGYNDAATGRNIVVAPSAGGEWLAAGAADRARPGSVAAAGSLAGTTQAQQNQLIRAFRNVWSADSRAVAPNSSLGMVFGGSRALAGLPSVGYVGSLSYSHATEVRADERRALAFGDGQGGAQVTSSFRGQSGKSSVLVGGLLNLSALVGTSRLVLNNTYNRTADNEGRRDFGYDEPRGYNLERTTLRYVERSLLSSQLKGEHAIGAGTADWQLALSDVQRREPDRSDVVYTQLEDGRLVLLGSDIEGVRRTFGDLSERSYSGGANYQFNFGGEARRNFVKLGALSRFTTRDALNQSYSFLVGGLTPDELTQSAERIFDGRYAGPDDTHLQLRAIGLGGSYDAREQVHAGYLMSQHGLGERFRLVGGLRVERWNLDMNTTSTLGQASPVDRAATDVLPSLALNVKLTERQNLRISGSQTLARPEYRELAPITYLDVIGGEAVQGATDLQRTLIQSADMRWEWYPNPGELFSVAVFAKQFDEPIERVQIATSGTSLVSFANADRASNLGVELEARKGLGGLGALFQPLSAFTNVTVMRSSIGLRDGGTASFQNSERAMVGQAPYVVNTGMTYASESGRASATLLYNVVGRRIYSAAAQGLPDVYEQPRNVLDASVRFPLFAGVSGKVDGRNLLDAPYRLTQGAVTRESYRTGRVLSVGFSWIP